MDSNYLEMGNLKRSKSRRKKGKNNLIYSDNSQVKRLIKKGKKINLAISIDNTKNIFQIKNYKNKVFIFD